MTPRPLNHLWPTLEELPRRSTERLEWRQRLADEWLAASRLLRGTGRLAGAVACPTPATDGCPRKIVHHADGRIVAVCGDRPQRCEKLDLLQDDIEVLELNVAVLASGVRVLLGLTEPGAVVSTPNLIQIGTIPVRAGLGLPVLLGFPNAEQPILHRDLPALSVGEMAGVVLTPTARFIDELPAGWSSLSLAELFVVDEHHAIVAREGATAAIDRLKEKALDLSRQSNDVAWALPADARWQEMVFEFPSPGAVNIRFRGETRRFEPEQLDMKHKRTGNPTVQWTLLQGLAELDGQMSWSAPGAHRRNKKQKQLLSDKLKAAFGIPGDPIEWVRGSNAYQTTFKISGTPLGYRHADEARRARR